MIPASAMLWGSACQPHTDKSSWTVRSPESQLALELTLDDGILSYSITNGDEVLMQPSTLGLVTEQHDADLLSYDHDNTRSIHETYRLTSGKQLEHQVEGQETQVFFHTFDGLTLRIDLRAYPDGVAFRYAFPEGDSLKITQELTEFHVGPDRTGWMQEYAGEGDYFPVYETPYQNAIPSGTEAPGKAGWAFPMLFRTGKSWMLITESDVMSYNYGAHISPRCDSGIYRVALPFQEEALGVGSVSVAAKTPFTTPWRVIIAGDELSTIVESSLVTDLATPSVVKDTGWIRPGRSTWSWWSEHSSSRHAEALNRYVDLAADLGFEYSLVDANWNKMESGTISEVIDHAREKNVGLTLWYNSGGPHNDVTEAPRDRMYDPEIRKEEMQKLEQWGIKGIKVDFFQSDKPVMMKQYLGILQDAADHHLLVDFHGSTLPRGWSRTYPNLMSMEGIRGAEQLGWSDEYAQKAPMLNTIVAFTRNVVGPMDYTPVTFSSYDCCPHRTTNAHELALSVVFESGIQHFADNDSSYRAQPEEVWKFISDVPVAWDETRLISGTPGEDIVLARRKGTEWYVAGINGQDKAKNMVIKLPETVEGNYSGTLLKDGNDDHSFEIREVRVGAGAEATVEVRPNGGFCVKLTK